jgi:hypothetical protein
MIHLVADPCRTATAYFVFISRRYAGKSARSGATRVFISAMYIDSGANCDDHQPWWLALIHRGNPV